MRLYALPPLVERIALAHRHAGKLQFYAPGQAHGWHGEWASGNENQPPHIAKLKIPPAWKNVRYNLDPKADLLVVGQDDKGRRTAIYSCKHWKDSSAEKFRRITRLEASYDAIMRRNEQLLTSKDPITAGSAKCLALIANMGLRPGSERDRGGEVKANGATTLTGSHVIVEGGKVSLAFIGKHGVSLNLPVEDKGISRMLVDLKSKAGDDGKLFGINEGQLIDHVHSLTNGRFSTKDFRTLLAARTANAAIEKMTMPTNKREYKASVSDVAKVVSAKLGNTPTVALQSYIPPQVFAQWRVAQ